MLIIYSVQIGAAWDLCQRHFEQRARGYDFLDARDDDIWLDSDDLDAFYVYGLCCLLAASLTPRADSCFLKRSLTVTHATAGDVRVALSLSPKLTRAVYRDHRSHPAPTRTSSVEEQQRKEKQEYEKRRRELGPSLVFRQLTTHLAQKRK